MPHRNNGEVSLESWHCTYPQQESHLPQFLLLSHARQGDIKSYDLFLYGNVIFIRVFFFFHASSHLSPLVCIWSNLKCFRALFGLTLA